VDLIAFAMCSANTHTHTHTHKHTNTNNTHTHTHTHTVRAEATAGFQAEYFLAGSVSGSFKCQIVYIEPSYAPSPTSFKEYPGFDKCVTDFPNPCRNDPSRPQEVEILKSLI
jgi:hypothetical protein